MKKPQLNRSPMNDRAISNDPIAELFKKLEGSGRLTASDKPIFATNLGKLAARLSPDDPLDGARRIVSQAGTESLWPTKRKKYFRLPGEDAPPAGKDGAYASNPSQFRKLAEAAGELLCGSKKPEAIKLEQGKAVKALVDGSSFMPHYVPTDISDISAIELLDEYATALADAIKSKTRITQLWDILKATQISVKPFWPDEIGEAGNSHYGSAADFPQSLMQPTFRKGAVLGEFTNDYDFGGWSKPTVEIGRLAITKQIRMFRIPKNKQDLFSPEHCADRILSRQAVQWLEDVGFDGEAGTLPDLDIVEDDMGWDDATAAIMKSVGIGIQPRLEINEVEVIISCWGDLEYLVEFSSDITPFSEINFKGKFESGRVVAQYYSCEFRNNLKLDIVYSEPISIDDDLKAVAIGILPSGWSYDVFPDWDVSKVFYPGDSINDISENNFAKGWTENSHIAELLLGVEGVFYPIWPDCSPIAGVFAEDSLAASLMQNQRTASKENLITTHLIDKVALTAEAGLKFYEAMVDDLRSAIHRI